MEKTELTLTIRVTAPANVLDSLKISTVITKDGVPIYDADTLTNLRNYSDYQERMLGEIARQMYRADQLIKDSINMA